MSQERPEKALNAAIEALMAYYDSVQIFVTKTKDDDTTIGTTAGKGNLFARVGQIGLWIGKVQNDLIDGIEDDEDDAGA